METKWNWLMLVAIHEQRLLSAKPTPSGSKMTTRVCYECNMIFGWSSNYQRHMRIHTKEHPFQCMHCSRGFSNSSNRRKHERRCVYA